jgi:hypothetical protein
MAKIMPAVKKSNPNGVPLKIGIQPKYVFRGISKLFTTQERSTKMPQSPKITLGTAASNSTRYETGTLMLLGAISTRKIAMPKLNGTPISRAMPEVTSVPKM